MVRRIPIGVLSDSRLFREALSCRLASQEKIEVVCSAATVHELLMRAQGRPIDVLLVHLEIESRLALEIVWDIRALMPAARVVLLGCEQGTTEAVRWIEADATRLPQATSFESLLETIQAVSEGRAFCSPEVMPSVIQRLAELQRANGKAEPSEKELLTDREAEILELMALGLSDKLISRRLGIKPTTAKSHVRKVLRGLRLRRRWDIDLRRTTRRARNEGGEA